ncbi:RimJ/RimL family protein N-acetyltransferase [Paenibacillus anaericanus]|uniref:GNAT family N-acetyltransferase n=1 Tax=Paenibacillus anaericanus TaxID=170367 RepID=UPI0027895121|nr:GNAT family N-acetyltransferase [Paenibacillus anaericanus]MDQ0088848.1 RimJ/RimL family protein N-acetyltransferase [Paenibacillus anaericanus]
METKRLIIRRFNSNDGEDLKEYAIYKESTGFDAWEKWPTDLEGCRGVAEFFAGSDNYWAVCRKSDGKMIGFISFNNINEDRHLDLGHGFILEHNQDGEDVEAMELMMQYAFENLDIVAVDTHNVMEWKDQVTPLFKLGLIEIEDRMQITRVEWCKRIF